jgi:hypothetical protein
MVLRRRLALAATLVFLAAATGLMVGEAIIGGDWPGWDEGWAMIVFPLGVPLPVAFGLTLARSRLQRVAAVTGAVWAWGAVIFLLWVLIG